MNFPERLKDDTPSNALGACGGCAVGRLCRFGFASPLRERSRGGLASLRFCFAVVFGVAVLFPWGAVAEAFRYQFRFVPVCTIHIVFEYRQSKTRDG